MSPHATTPPANRQRGLAALELALMLPLLLVLPASAWDLGRAVMQTERLHHAVRAAVRHLATGDAADPLRQEEARRMAVYGRMQGSGAPIVPGLQTSMVDILEPAASPGLRSVATPQGPVSLVTVEIRGLRFEPLLLPAAAGFVFRPVSLTLVYRII
jgi:Flp pilus assembly protein TadG